METIDRKNWKDERNWSPLTVVDGREGLRISLSGWTADEIGSLTDALKSANIEFGTKKASVSQYNIQAGDPTLRILDPQSVENLKSLIFSQAKEPEKQTGSLKSSIQSYAAALSDEAEKKTEADKRATERSADFWSITPYSGYAKKEEVKKETKKEPFISPWDTFISNLDSDKIVGKEKEAFYEAIKNVKNMDFKAPDGSSLSPSQWKDISGNTLYILLADRGQTELLRILTREFYSSKEELERQNDVGISPLHAAARGGHTDTCKFLVEEKRVNAQSRNKNGDLPFQMAAGNNYSELADYLRIKYGMQHLSNPEKDPKYKADQDARNAKLYGAYRGY